MDKMRKIVIWIGVYFLVFWIGFRSGDAYFRMRNKIDERREKITLPAPLPSPPRVFYIIDRIDVNRVNFSEVGENDVIIKFFFNKNLRPLLKLRDLKIYTSDGERIY